MSIVGQMENLIIADILSADRSIKKREMERWNSVTSAWTQLTGTSDWSSMFQKRSQPEGDICKTTRTGWMWLQCSPDPILALSMSFLSLWSVHVWILNHKNNNFQINHSCQCVLNYRWALWFLPSFISFFFLMAWGLMGFICVLHYFINLLWHCDLVV